MKHIPPHYDYIVAGGGAAGLSLIMHILQEPALATKSILLIEMEEKDKNDRTWCFWEQGEGFFESIVYRKWKKVWFHAQGYSSLNNLGAYAYKMIRGIDFYRYCFGKIREEHRVTIVKDRVCDIANTSEGVVVTTEKESVFTGQYAFSSIVPAFVPNLQLLQHFKGWVVETDQPFFDALSPTFMDFRVAQDLGATFVYVMPLSSTRALIEYTLFTPSLLDDQAYEQALQEYIREWLKLEQYTIAEKEFGIIPMTDHPFQQKNGNIIYIGTAGGQTKPSSGFTFRFVQKQSASLVRALAKSGKPNPPLKLLQKRFLWYDRVLLHVLCHKLLPGDVVFRQLFKKNQIGHIFSFLDNESNLLQDLRLIGTLPTWPFLKATIQEIRRILYK